MNNIQVFQNAQFGQIRTAVTEAGEPLFCLADVCKSLGLSNPSIVAQKLDEEERPKLGLGRQGVATFVTEPGMYTVILRSDSPKAKPMQKWVTSEVLPALRKTGGYMVARTDETPEQIMARALIVAQDTIKRTEAEKARLIEQNELSKRELQLAAPKVLFADAVATSDRSVLVAELAKILQQNGVNIGQNRLFEWLRRHGYLCSKGEYYNQPAQYAMEMGLFELKKTSITKPDGSILVTCTTKVTGKGQIYFVNKFTPERHV